VAISTLFHEAPLDVLREHPQLLLELLALGRAGLALGPHTSVTLLELLRLRGFVVDETTAERILATTDEALLDRWVARLLSARTLDEVLEG
jgi:hypothetical protein